MQFLLLISLTFFRITQQQETYHQTSSVVGTSASSSSASFPVYSANGNCLHGCDGGGVDSEIRMNSILRPGEYIPNCGCVSRGACTGEISQYTRLVGQYSDVVCGWKFERCCFDGPCQGVVDEYARAAACVPEEQCLRPYGVLPTDVRDFGIIAPCPGHGAVRCIAVDDYSLLEFQAAVAAIEASNARYSQFPQFEVPVAPARFPPPPEPQEVFYQQVAAPVVGKPASVSTANSFTAASTFNSVPAPASFPSPPEPQQVVPVPVVVPAHQVAVVVPIPIQQVVGHTASVLTDNGNSFTSASTFNSVPATPVPVPPPVFHFEETPDVVAPIPTPVVVGAWPGLGFRKHFYFSKRFGYGLF